MGWIESVTKEGFQLAVREAMRLDMERLENRMGDVDQRVARLEGTIMTENSSPTSVVAAGKL